VQHEARALLGRHDFTSFMASDKKEVNPVRNIYNITLKKEALSYL
jgi:tRNA U38,U39,U40 pseudouridine synthase TruA